MKINVTSNSTAPRKLIAPSSSSYEKTVFKVNCPLKWHFFDSVLFSLVTITTIGYGHQVPKTKNGQMFCLIYAATGIPLIGFFVYYWTKGVNIMDRVHWQRWLFLRHDKKCAKKETNKDNKNDGDSDCECEDNFREEPTDELSPHRLLPFIVVWYVMPTLLFWLAERHTQGWDLFTAFYFCFITLSSIGFGDYTPSIGTSLPASDEIQQNHKGVVIDALYYCYVFCWILSGFVCTSVFLDRLGNKAKYAAKVGLEVTANQRSAFFDPISARIINSDYKFSTRKMSMKNNKQRLSEESEKIKMSLEKPVKPVSFKFKRSMSLESTSLTNLTDLTPGENMKNALFLERQFFPTAFSREISYDKCEESTSDITDENVQIYTDSDILKSVTGNDILLC